MMLGLSLYAMGRSAFDAASLPWELWTRDSFTASPWTGTASAGDSGSRDLTEAVFPPGVSAALDGFTSPDFDGGNDRLVNATSMTSLISVAAGTIAVMFYADAAAADAGANAYYNNPGLFSDTSARLALSFSNSGVRLGSYNGATFDTAAVVACGTGAWHAAIARWDNTTMELSIDGGTFTTGARTIASDISAATLIVGANYNSAVFFNGRIREILAGQFRASDGQASNLYAYLKARYPSAGLP